MSDDEVSLKNIPEGEEEDEEGISEQYQVNMSNRSSLVQRPSKASLAEKRESLPFAEKRKSLAFAEKRESIGFSEKRESLASADKRRSSAFAEELERASKRISFADEHHGVPDEDEDASLQMLDEVPGQEPHTFFNNHVPEDVQVKATLTPKNSYAELPNQEPEFLFQNQDHEGINELHSETSNYEPNDLHQQPEPEVSDTPTNEIHEVAQEDNTILQLEEGSSLLGETKSSRLSEEGVVKFLEPLNVPDELESKYEELMGEEKKFVHVSLEEDFGEFSHRVSETSRSDASPLPHEYQIANSDNNLEVEVLPMTLVDDLSQQSSRLSDGSQIDVSTVGSDFQTVTVAASELVHTVIENGIQNALENEQKSATESYQHTITASHLDPLVNQEDDQNDPYGAYEITPEDIFNEIQVARAENQEQEQEHAQNLHSFIISKTFSSENVVVLLNLRRMPDGEWVLDKTIAQGLKPQTYGGVVSIDQYEFQGQPSKQQESQDESRSLKQIPSQRNSDVHVPENIHPGSKNIMDTLKKLEDYVADINREIQAAREALKQCNCVDNQTDVNDSSCEPHNIDELPFLDKLIRMFNMLLTDENEPCCNLCDNIGTIDQAQSAISFWLRSIIQEISNYCPAMLLPKAINDIRDISTTSMALISQSQAMLEEVRKSGLLNKLSNSGLLSLKQSVTGVLPDLPLPNISSGLATLSGVLPFMGENRQSAELLMMSDTGSSLDESPANIEAVPSVESPSTEEPIAIMQADIQDDLNAYADTSNYGPLQINIESKDDLDEFLKEHEV